MPFGLGFNKGKALSAAEKFVAQGKIPAAIEEYQKLLARDPKDLMILNTVADLYARTGQNEEALKRFFELAERCVEAGLVNRAIAVYKRISKIAPDSILALLKLGELYSMQGLLRDARAHYLQAVEFYSQSNEKVKARDAFEKVLMLDMENPQVQVRMAELYAETGKKEEAITTYLGAVERFLDRNQPAEADSALQVLLRLDPQNPEALALLGRAQLERGDFGKAVETLQAIPSLATQKGVLNLLFHGYTRLGNSAKAREVANQLFDGHEDFAGLAQIAEELVSRGQVNEALEIYDAATERLVIQRASSFLIDVLQKIQASQPSHIGALELMLKVHRMTRNVGEARETIELLAHAYVAQGELEKARELYTELVATEPENPDHLRLLRQVEEQMGVSVAPSEASMESAAAMVSDLSATSTEDTVRIEALPRREDELVRNCLTESELYITYHQAGRAIEALEKGLSQLPDNITLNEQLLPLYEQSKDYRKAAKCCEVLTEAYVKLGDGERASRYGELVFTYQQKAQAGESQPVEAPPAEEAVPAEMAEVEAFSALAPTTTVENQPQVREVDLSMEWASVSSGEVASAPGALEESAVEEIEFYIQAGLVSDATAALERLRDRSPSHPAIPQFQERLGLIQAQAAPGPEGKSPLAAFPTEHEPPAASEAPPEAERDLALEEVLPSMESFPPGPAFEFSLEEAAVQPLQTATSASAPPHLSRPAVDQNVLGTPAEIQGPFANLAGELEEALNPPGQPNREQPPPSPQPVAFATPPTDSTPGPASPPQGNILDDVFAEFKAGMEEPTIAEDLETHYNMGVAFKEMALYDEAIGEFQKVHQLAVRKNDYSHLVQCCSLLATCFLEKGLPQLAVKWYQTALDSPGLDPESVQALLYEMASAYEIAGDRQAALRSFLEVYSRNIDYRDVAERIRSIQQAQ